MGKVGIIVNEVMRQTLAESEALSVDFAQNPILSYFHEKPDSFDFLRIRFCGLASRWHGPAQHHLTIQRAYTRIAGWTAVDAF